MLYYFGGKFSPWTRGHFKVLDALCQKIADEGSWNKGDQIIIGLIDLPDLQHSGIAGHVLCSSEEYREELISSTLNYIYNKYWFTKDGINFVYQKKKCTYEFLKDYCKDHLLAPLEGNVTLVLGQDEYDDLVSSTKDHLVESFHLVDNVVPKWKYADELMEICKFFTYARDKDGTDISATKVREIFHRNPYTAYDEVKNYIFKSSFNLIKSNHCYWQYGFEDEYRRDETNALKKYDIEKFPRPSATVDMMIIDGSNNILLIRRKNFPYKGFWALPGGFLDINEDETLEEAASRELFEETDISFNFKRIHQFRTYSDMGTDPRGRIVDTVYVAKDKQWWPKAGDDACEFGWFKMSELPRMAFNHRQIIEDYLSTGK